MKTSTWIAAVVVSIAGQTVIADQPLSIKSDDDIKASAGRLAKGLLSYYKGNEPGEIPGILPGPPPNGDYYWYQAAFMWASLIDYWHYTGDDSHNDVVSKGLLFQRGEANDFIEANWTLALGNDDQGAWGRAALLAAERNFAKPADKDAQWIKMAQNVFDEMASRWDDKACGGGLRWQVPRFNAGYDYKNVLSNGALFDMAGRLAHYTGNKTYVDWANKSWDWMAKIGIIDTKTYHVYDGGHVEDDCKRISKEEFTINNGLLLHGAAYMFNHTGGEAKWRDRVNGLIDQGIKTFFMDGVLVEVTCEPQFVCKTDMRMFKGNALRDYADAAQLAPFVSDKINSLLKSTAAEAVKNCKSPDNCSLTWSSYWRHENKEYYSPSSSRAGESMNVLNAVSVLLSKSASTPATAKTDGSSDKSGSEDESKGCDANDSEDNKDKKSAGVKKNSFSLLSAVTLVSVIAHLL